MSSDTDELMHEPVSYYSDGLEIAAYLYVPDDWEAGDPPRPAVVSIHGYGGMKELFCLDIPERLCEAGYVVLAPDHRGLGDSEGSRTRHRPLEQAQDIYDGITYLETLDAVDPDRIGVYGTSFGGATAIWVAAFDERVRAVVSSCGVCDARRWQRTIRRPYEWREFEAWVRDSARERVQTGEPDIVGLDEIRVRDPENQSITEKHREERPDYVPETDLESAEAGFRFRPEWVVDRISPRPALFISAENDVTVPPAEQRSCYEACGEPKKFVELPDTSHYEAYATVDAEKAEPKLRETVAWFDEHL